ncbi:MBL fold metallo-hydrolase [Blastococcus sp. SYSU D00820]
MSTSTHQHVGIEDAVLQEVAEGVFAYLQPDGSWWINNTGFVVGSQGVVSIDGSSTRRRTEAYLERISSVTAAPVRTVVNTHHHGDHTHGNYLFTDATVVAHELCRTEMLATGLPPDGVWDPVDWGDLRVRPPELTYRTGITIWADDTELQVSHVGTPAHTTNDSVVWLPGPRVLFAGDLLFNGGTPFVLMGSVAGTIEVLDSVVRAFPADVIVPGHGQPCGPELIDDVIDYLRLVQTAAREGSAAGLTPLETARDLDLGRFAGLLDAERIVGNLHRAYAELGEAERGVRIDVAAALADMVTFNGGRPLSCYA